MLKIIVGKKKKQSQTLDNKLWVRINQTWIIKGVASKNRRKVIIIPYWLINPKHCLLVCLISQDFLIVQN